MNTTHSIVIDDYEIRRLALIYANGADKRDGDLFASVFTPDGILELNDIQTAGEAKLAKIPRMLARFSKTYHTVLNTRIDIDGDTATGEIYSAAHHLKPLEDGRHTDKVWYVTYLDDYVRTADGWRIAHRKVVSEFIEYTFVSAAD